jgi:hypothetical protein
MTTDLATRDPNSVTLVARWSGGAFRSDLGATLTIDGTQVLTKDNAPAPQAGNLSGGCVGLFLEDANKDGKTELGLVTSAPFIAFSDVYMQAKTPSFVQLSLTAGSEDTNVVSKTAVISNWASSGALINVFFQ